MVNIKCLATAVLDWQESARKNMAKINNTCKQTK